MKKAMKLEEIIAKAKKETPNLLVQDLLEEFQEFAKTLQDLRSFKGGDVEGREFAIQKMNESNDRLRAYFMRVAASFGMTLDQFQEFIGNADHFEPQDWAEIQSTKQHVLANLEAPIPEKKSSKKLNKKERI